MNESLPDRTASPPTTTRLQGRATVISPLPYRPCVGILLLNARGQVFLARRIDIHDAWQMPQGGIDKGESPRKAARRELCEETGITAIRLLAESTAWHRYDLPEPLIGKVWGGRWRGQEQKWLAALFTGSDDEIDVATKHPEFDAWRWEEPEQVTAVAPAFKRQVYEAILLEFAPIIAAVRAGQT